MYYPTSHAGVGGCGGGGGGGGAEMGKAQVQVCLMEHARHDELEYDH